MILDREHGPASTSEKHNLLRAAQVAGVLPPLSGYAPAGSRGVRRFVCASRSSSIERSECFELASRTTVIVQIEGPQGICDLEAIPAVEGMGIVFIEPYDL